MIASDRIPWLDRAECRGADPAIFFPVRGGLTGAAKAICARCPVSAECVEHAMSTGERHGIWGGVSVVNERRRRNRERVA